MSQSSRVNGAPVPQAVPQIQVSIRLASAAQEPDAAGLTFSDGSVVEDWVAVHLPMINSQLACAANGDVLLTLMLPMAEAILPLLGAARLAPDPGAYIRERFTKACILPPTVRVLVRRSALSPAGRAIVEAGEARQPLPEAILPDR